MHELITILGPTASGKTGLAAVLAARIDGEVISADSRQVYRGMDLGTGKDLDVTDIYLCPICGHIEFGKPPGSCPICGAKAEKFVQL